MIRKLDLKTKKNVSQFNKDVQNTNSYLYTTSRLSCRLANERISNAVYQAYDFSGKRVLDLGCGDGTYTLEFASFGVKSVVGVDPAGVAIEAANKKIEKLGLDEIVKFEIGNIYELESYLNEGHFDCIILRGVLHHLPDPALAITGLTSFNGTIIIIEPNGINPVVKLLEKYSRYHIEHEEQSFALGLIRSWLEEAGFFVYSSKFINLVPFFCPDWMASVLRIIQPIIEHLPYVRNITCGQCVIVAEKTSRY